MAIVFVLINRVRLDPIGLVFGLSVLFVGPDEGAMACGEFGPGRLAEPPVILAAIRALLEPSMSNLAARPLASTVSREMWCRRSSTS